MCEVVIPDEEIDRETFKNLIINATTNIAFKFTANWCGPCQKSKEYFDEKVELFNKENPNPSINTYLYILDVDEHFDIYALLKSKKMTKGIPCYMLYALKGKDERPNYYTSDVFVSGGENNNINLFFEYIKKSLT